MFRTRRARGATIVVVAASAVATYAVADAKARTAVDANARSAANRMRADLPGLAGLAPYQLVQAPTPTSYDSVGYVDGGEGLAAFKEVRSLWQVRCVVGTRTVTGEVNVRVVAGTCP